MIFASLSALADHLWQSTVFAGVVYCLVLTLRKNRASVRYVLWLAASLKFLVPFSLLVSIGSPYESRTIAAVARPEVVSALEGVGRPFSFQPSKPQMPLPPAVGKKGIRVSLFSLWLSGAAVFGFLWFREWRRMRRVIKGAVPLSLAIPVTAMSSSACVEPAVVGIFRPVLLLPHGITERLTRGQLEAILAHELSHIRRHDNLSAAIHMAVEMLFWFHPLVWWLERRLVSERERACDEAVLRQVAEPQEYAEGILNVCKFYKESRLVCVSGVTGSNLKIRIEEIMMNRMVNKLGVAKTLLLVIAGVAVVAVPVGLGIAHASQVPAEKIETESVQEKSGSGNWLEGIEAAGYRDLDVDDLMRLKEHGIDSGYIRQIRASGFDLTPDELMRFKEHDINDNFINDLAQVGLRDLTADDLMRLREHQVDANRVRQIRSMGFPDASMDDILRLIEHEITPGFVNAARQRFNGIDLDQMLRLKEHGILEVR